jgi:hypothetical protein
LKDIAADVAAAEEASVLAVLDVMADVSLLFVVLVAPSVEVAVAVAETEEVEASSLVFSAWFCGATGLHNLPSITFSAGNIW